MADYSIAYPKIKKKEAGYVYDEDDRGGETYCGISRNNHPDWPGWEIVDRLKKSHGFPIILEADAALEQTVRYFYKVEYWDKCHCDEIISQAIADEIFDTAVLMWKPTVATILQRSLNALNRQQKDYPNVPVDGVIGPLTLGALSSYLDIDTEDLLLIIMNGLQLARHIEIMEKDETQEKYTRGYIRNRVIFTGE